MEANRSKPDQEFLSLKKTYEKNRIMLGEDSKETLTSLDSLADYYDRAGDYDEAVELGEELLSKRTDLYGEDHEATIETSTKQIQRVKAYDEKLSDEELGKMSELSDVQVQEKNLQFQKKQLLSSIASLERKIADLVESIENKNKIPSWGIYQQTLNDMDELEKELKDETLRLLLLKVGSEVVSPESIKKNIVSKVVASINAMINQYLTELCVNFTCNLSSDMNDYEIQSSGGELDFPNLSLGEQMKLLISSQLAFRKFLISRFNVCMNVMIIDEVVDRALDSVSIQKLLGILLQLSQKENTNVSIISHRSEVEQMFGSMPDTQTLVIQKQNNISKIVRGE